MVWDTVSESGLCRLTGHRGPITQIVFMGQQQVLISSAKDTFVKFWDLDTQHCFKTLVGHRTEVWGLSLMKDDKYIVTGSGDAELRVWKLSLRDPDSENKNSIDTLTANLELTSLDDDDNTVSIIDIRCK